MNNFNFKKNNVMVKLVKSFIGCLPKHKKILNRLNLKKIGKVIFITETSCNLGMLKKIFYLIKIKRVVV